jgi:hypothetical protein
MLNGGSSRRGAPTRKYNKTYIRKAKTYTLVPQAGFKSAIPLLEKITNIGSLDVLTTHSGICDHSPPISAEIKNTWIYTYPLPNTSSSHIA